MKINIDTNILIYSKDKNSKYYNNAISILKEYEDNIVITSKNISEFIAVSSKNNIEYKKILTGIELMINKFEILYPNDNSLKIFYELLEKYKPKGNRVYDIEIVSIMLSNGINTISTINKSDFENISEINIISI